MPLPNCYRCKSSPCVCKDGITLILGDCLAVMQGMEAASVDAIVTDPPYGLKFMVKRWDHGIPGIPFWEAALRVAKPGAHLLAFGGTRTFHRLTCAIEDAGWEIRDCIMWVYGSGFPKSENVSIALDKKACREELESHLGRKPTKDEFKAAWATYREIVGKNPTYRKTQEFAANYNLSRSPVLTAPATDAAKQWAGFGTALKPAYEPIIIARKKLEGTVAANILKHGCGGLNIDACRIGTDGGTTGCDAGPSNGIYGDGLNGSFGKPVPGLGRWPANLIHDSSDEVVELFPETANGSGTPRRSIHHARPKSVAKGAEADHETLTDFGDSGSASRFFYCAKSSRSERGKGNSHPTVKPLALMHYLVRLVTPPGGLVLDPFAGSGTTGRAAKAEGCRCICIDMEESSVAIQKAVHDKQDRMF